MNCEKFQMVVTDLAREQIMEVSDRTSALDHIAGCERCAMNLEDELTLSLGLHTLANEMKGVSAPVSLEAKMLAAFREHKNANPVVNITSRRPASTYWVAAIAAMIILTLGFFILRGVLSNRRPIENANLNSPKPETLAGTPGSREVKTPEAPPAGPDSASVPRPKIRPSYVAIKHEPKTSPSAVAATSTGTSQKNSVSQPAAEVATDFFPIGFNSTPNLQEGGQLLRVELPRAAVARFGLPVNMDRAGERVKADVLVGADGLAQAIRFVQ
ncbi:MAG TPA: hypothetical protein VGN86_10100 [Pyrinomonadaceae bacterium]|jgi:hypothetical protein|nr:hypothetical protein [Pyrinomonadaceae bacterium]